MLNKKLSVKLSLALALLVASVLALSSWFTVMIVDGTIDEISRDELDKVLQVTQIAATSYNESLESAANRLSATFANQYPLGFNIVPDSQVALMNQQLPDLRHGNESLLGNYSVVDQFAQATGGNATIFVRSGDDFVRLVTSVVKQDGTRAVATKLDRQSPAYQPNLNGQAYTGKVELFGRRFITNYTPIKNQLNQVIGIRYIGIPFSQSLDSLIENLAQVRIGQAGHLFIIDASQSSRREQFVMHPSLQGKQLNGLTNKLVTMTDSAQVGNLKYQIPQKEEWIAHYAYIPELEWIVGATVPKSQLSKPGEELQTWLFLMAAITVIILIMGLTISINQFVGKPLKYLIKELSSLAEGDYSRDVTRSHDDEVGDLQQAVIDMQRQVRRTISELSTVASSLAAAALQLSETSDEVSTASNEQRDSVLSVSSTIEEMSTSIEIISSNAQESQALSQSSFENAQDGVDVITRASQEMKNIAETVTQASKEVKELGELSNEIPAIIKVIQGIAEQTNLLALNAAIEAARAGEQGRGFAVVADEVRELSARTAASTHDITKTVDLIQTGTARAVATMVEGVKQVEIGAELSDKTAQAIGSIQANSQQVMENFQTVSEMLNEHVKAANEVASRIADIQTAARSNSDSVRDVSQAVRDLGKMADTVQRQVMRFRISS